MAPAAMATTCPADPASAVTRQRAEKAMDARVTSGARLRPMPQTACATTATATSFSPWTRPDPTGPPRAPAL